VSFTFHNPAEKRHCDETIARPGAARRGGGAPSRWVSVNHLYVKQRRVDRAHPLMNRRGRTSCADAAPSARTATRRRPQPIPRPDDPAPRDFGPPADTGFFRHCDVLSLNSPGAHLLPIGRTRWPGPPRAHQRPELAHQRRRDDDTACDPKLARGVRDIEVAPLVATGHERLGAGLLNALR